ncbi:MAG: two-component system response regulator OmpR [Lysobacter sp.]|nr:two-component system response regulator OmpR [Lysobacter sp.]
MNIKPAAAVPAPCILVVDDDERLRALLLRYLEQQGFQPLGAADARELDRQLARHHIDLIVLDLMLPGEDGLSICRRLRGQGVETPIVMLTAKGDEVDRIVGLEIGADDYLPKPGNPRELVARIRAVMRRGRSAPGAPKEDGGRIAFGGCVLDLGARTLHRDGGELRMTTGEFAVLAALVQRPRQALTRDQLMSAARGREHDAFERSMDVMISRLRKLVEDDPKHPRWLQTVWGTGYVFVPDNSAPNDSAPNNSMEPRA